MKKRISLIGTVTSDAISRVSGYTYEGLGGVLYQAAVLCALEQEVFLYSNMGRDLEKEVTAVTSQWPALDTGAVTLFSIPSNRVRLHYPEKGERIEILESVVPSLNAGKVLDDVRRWDLGILVCNSGFDIAVEDWRRIVRSSLCPLWLDIHSLVLSKELGSPRAYVPLPEWRDWVAGVPYLQANLMELSCMLGHPGIEPSEKEMQRFASRAFDLGVKTVFITLGRDGVQVITPADFRRISSSSRVKVVDTTGCGDVFCAAAAAKLGQGAGAVDSAVFGVRLASRAAGTRGIKEIHALIKRHTQEES